MAEQTGTQTISDLMARLREGDHTATREIFERLYPELRRMASMQMSRERSDHTWQPTALVNELYLELLKVRSLKGGDTPQHEKEAFFHLAAFLMRRLLIHHARPLYRKAEMTELDELAIGDTRDNGSLAEIENLLERLSALNPAFRSVVEMRVFEGMTMEEIAGRLGCSVKTVQRHWVFAQRWLQEAMGQRTQTAAAGGSTGHPSSRSRPA